MTTNFVRQTFYPSRGRCQENPTGEDHERLRAGDKGVKRQVNSRL